MKFFRELNCGEVVYPYNSELFCLNYADGPMKIAELEMEKLELLSSVPCSRDGFAEDVKLETLMIFKYYQKSPEAF